MAVVSVLIEDVVQGVHTMLSDGAIALMNLVRAGCSALYSDDELSTRDYHLLMDVAESILREHEGE